MANRLNVHLRGKVVVLDGRFYEGDERARRFLCRGGYGLMPEARGKAIIGTFLADGEECRVEGYEVEKLSDDQDTTVGAPMIETKEE